MWKNIIHTKLNGFASRRTFCFAKRWYFLTLTQSLIINKNNENLRRKVFNVENFSRKFPSKNSYWVNKNVKFRLFICRSYNLWVLNIKQLTTLTIAFFLYFSDWFKCDKLLSCKLSQSLNKLTSILFTSFEICRCRFVLSPLNH